MRRMVKPLERRKENFIILPNHPIIHGLLKHMEFSSVDTIEKTKNCPGKGMKLDDSGRKKLYTLSIDKIEITPITKARSSPNLSACRRLQQLK
jgi:hypothetical protein